MYRDPWKPLKRFGRLWCILTHEDQQADPSIFQEILLIRLASDLHAEEARERLASRFPWAVVHLSPPLAGWRQTLQCLRPWRREQLSAVVILSLHPVLTALVCRTFACYKLLYNRWGEWYLVRPKTLHEWLCGRRGEDDRMRDWPGDESSIRMKYVLAMLLKAVPRSACQGVRAIRLACWILWRVQVLLFRKVRSLQ